ncbi:GIY-YIG nuclease family protein [Phaeospirillum tilakii]|uniref:GIY-YIG nuclease family protein n=1 Tax=Phaeospirillum tilakii TaxID=741673 RepID=A0ABW5CB57_9PROT
MELYQITLTCGACDAETKGVLSPHVRELQCANCGAPVAKIKPFEGVVYVMSNPNIPGFVKVGMTTKDVYERAKQLSQTGVPGSYQVDAVFPSHRPKNDEAKAHAKLARFKANKEHFSLSTAVAIVKVRSALGGREPAFIREIWRDEVAEMVEKNRVETLLKLGKAPAEEAS